MGQVSIPFPLHSNGNWLWNLHYNEQGYPPVRRC